MLAILLFTACEKKSCDCEGLIGVQLSYGVDKDNIGNCIVIEDFSFKSDSTISIQRFFKDPEGSTNESAIDAIAEWRLISTNPCTYRVYNLRGATYGFPLVEETCSRGTNTENTFFYDLQFATDLKLEISNQTCDGATVNGMKMICD